MPINEKLERALVDYYNEYLPLFDSVPPYCSIPIPKAKTKKERKQKEYWDVVTFSSVKRRFEGIRELSPAAIDTFTSKKYEEKERWTINLNPVYFSCPRDLKEEVFPLLHEMTHVKEGILYKNNLKLENEKLPEMVLKSKELHAELNPKNLNPDGEDFVLLLCFLAEVILNDKNKMRKNQIVGKRGIKHSDPIKCLVEQLYPDKYVAYLKIQNKKIT